MCESVGAGWLNEIVLRMGGSGYVLLSSKLWNVSRMGKAPWVSFMLHTFPATKSTRTWRWAVQCMSPSRIMYIQSPDFTASLATVDRDSALTVTNCVIINIESPALSCEQNTMRRRVIAVQCHKTDRPSGPETGFKKSGTYYRKPKPICTNNLTMSMYK